MAVSEEEASPLRLTRASSSQESSQECLELICTLRGLFRQHDYVTEAGRAALRCNLSLEEPVVVGNNEEDGELPATVGMMMIGTRVERVRINDTSMWRL